jgi:hypothetical protein
MFLLLQQRLTTWNETKYEFSKMRDEFDKKIDNLRNKLQVKTDESNARHEGLIHYFWKVCFRGPLKMFQA